MQLRMAEMHRNPFVVGQGTEDRGGVCPEPRAPGGRRTSEKCGAALGRGNDLDRQGATGDLRDPNAWLEGVVSARLFIGLRQPSDEEGILSG